MSNPRAFISFDYDNNMHCKTLFVGQSKNSKVPFNIEDWSAKLSMPQNKWESIVEEKIKKTHMVIVLVGKNLETATGVKKEIQMALKNNIPILGVYVDGATSVSYLPPGLLRKNVVKWEWDKIAEKIAQMAIVKQSSK